MIDDSTFPFRGVSVFSMHRVLMCLTLAAALASGAQVPPGTTGMVHTPDVDLATFTYPGPDTKVPVIAVNGGPGLSHIYMLQNDLWSRVARTRTVVFYDQRGTGASQHLRPGASQSMDAQVADLEAVRDSMHVEKIDLVGDSYGGLLVSAYAAAHPEHVNALVLSDSAAPGFAALHPRLDEAFPDVVAKAKADAAKEHDPLKAADVDLRAHFRMIFYSQELCNQYLAGARDLGYSPATGEAVSNAIEKLDLTPQMAQFHFPTLVLNGRFDLNVTPDVAWKVAHTIPDAQLVLFEKSGHLPSYEEPTRYLAVLSEFLAKYDLPRRQ